MFYTIIIYLVQIFKQFFGFFQRMLTNRHAQIMSAQMKYSTVKNCTYINGQWVGSSNGKCFKVFNPANGELIGDVPNLGVDDVTKAIDSADKAFQSWSIKPAKVSLKFLMILRYVVANVLQVDNQVVFFFILYNCLVPLIIFSLRAE